jgi:glycosyltransferase involved in cell wall biosynthesis
MQPTLSVIIIAKNAEKTIYKCLNSLRFSNEMIVLDSGSSDRTKEICQQFTNLVFETDWQGFGIQKNRALEKATCEWVLSIDSDEEITEELALEIQKIICEEKYTAFYIPRLSNYCGRWMKHGGWYPDYVLRLWKRGTAHFTNDLIHEKVVVENGEIDYLKQPLLHYAYNDLNSVLNKVNSYSTIGAQMAFEKGKKSSLSKAVVHGLSTFVKSYFLKLGFLDGREGFILAVSNAEGCYYRYLKLFYLNQTKEQSD